MKRKFAELHYIDHNEDISPETYREFFKHLQKALLLALREQGTLNPVQYYRAAEILEQKGLRQVRVKFGQR